MRIFAVKASAGLILLASLIFGCSGHQVQQVNPPSAGPAEPGETQLPPLSDLQGVVPERSTSGAVIYRSGSDCLPGLTQGTNSTGLLRDFTSTQTGPSNGLAGAAFAIYHFNLDKVGGIESVALDWDTPPGDAANVWLGLSDWERGAWEWHSGELSSVVDLDVHPQYFLKPETKDMFLVVLLAGSESASLASVHVDGYYPLIPSLTGDQRFGVPPLTVNFDASASVSKYSEIVKYEWDWDGEGIGPWDADSGSSPVITHVYPAEGKFTAWVRVTDAAGNQATANAAIQASNDFGPGEWPMYGHDPQHTKRSAEIGPTSPEVKWTAFESSGIPSLAPSFGLNNTVYVGTSSLNLYCLSYGDSNPVWECPVLGWNGVWSIPAISENGIIYVAELDLYLHGKLLAIYPDGTKQWELPVLASASSPVLAQDGTIYIESLLDKLIAVAPDGSMKWEVELDNYPVFGSPAIGLDGQVYSLVEYDKLYAVSPEGEVNWTYPANTFLGGPMNSPTIGSNGDIYFYDSLYLEPGYETHLKSLNTLGDLNWDVTLERGCTGPPAIGADGTLYLCSGTSLLAVSPAGDTLWNCDIGLRLENSPAVDGAGIIYIVSDYTSAEEPTPKLHAVSPAGAKLWSIEIPGGGVRDSPVIGQGGLIYVIGEQLVAFGEAD